ncbi:MAG TPA: adenylate/guanylate cyclase domain-containing protein [Flavisolibacter sp.]|jgi:class 3 adenylate cyclase|nr:adenylate/guanylate cyclase domain-containing protein [Flavisolibacter sp.]
MAKISLKQIVGKNNDINSYLIALTKELGIEIWIEDVNGKVLMGASAGPSFFSFPVVCDQETIGWVKGNEKGILIANFLSHLAKKEAEKKSLGSEVLNLYQEINVIFNFSEKLSQTIEADGIAQITLDQAMHSIPSDSGIIVLWDNDKGQLQVPATSGERLFNEERIRDHASLLLKIGLSGQSEIINDISALKEKGIVQEDVQSLMYAAMKVKHRIMGAIILAATDIEQFSAAHLKLLVTLALQSSAAIESAKLYESNIRQVKEREEAILRIHEVTKKFVPNEFIRSLGKEAITDVRLGDQVEKVVTVLFTDIRDFTSISEKMTPEENFHFVSSFNARLGPIIRSHNGFINQYLGDSIMAIFPNSPNDALNAAVRMQKEVHDFNNERMAKGLDAIKTGIGMHTGSLIMGITGDNYRLDAATISDTVNTASRLESLTKHYNSNILLSDACLLQIDKSKFHLRYLGLVQLKGKQEPIHVYECFNGNHADDVLGKEKTLSLFNEGINHYLTSSFESSVKAFELVTKIHPQDDTAAFFLSSAKKYLSKGVPENWNGAIEMLMK